MAKKKKKETIDPTKYTNTKIIREDSVISELINKKEIFKRFDSSISAFDVMKNRQKFKGDYMTRA